MKKKFTDKAKSIQLSILNKTYPGFEGVSLKVALLGVREELRNDNLIIRASSMSFFFFLAIFPAIIFFFSLIPYLPVENYNIVLMGYLRDVLPSGIFGMLRTTISDILSIQRGGVTSLNFTMALIFSSNGVTSMLTAFDKTHDNYLKRKFLQKQLASFKLVILVSFMFLVSITLIILGERTIKNILIYFDFYNFWTYAVIVFLKYVIVFFAFFNVVASIYYYGPSVKEKFKYYSVGAIFTTFSLVVLSTLLKFYFKLFSNFNQLYGSLGIIIVSMLFVYLNSCILLIGYEINNSIANNKVKE
ncbi:MAG TPA: YihY/virulence factor BrkB family protein [Chitinophagales bacterium]|nr:YihY/virulence factor BrkB family protein [Chitinophagales bacterium]